MLTRKSESKAPLMSKEMLMLKSSRDCCVNRRMAMIKLQLQKNPGLARAMLTHFQRINVDGKGAVEYLLHQHLSSA